MRLTKSGKQDRRFIKYVMVEWREGRAYGMYRGGSYPTTIVAELLDALRQRGIAVAYVDGVEVDTFNHGYR